MQKYTQLTYSNTKPASQVSLEPWERLKEERLILAEAISVK